MISVATALEHLLDLVGPVDMETVPLKDANGRILAKPVAAARSQPPFAASAMDGYAVRAQDIAPGAQLDVIGEAAAGHAWAGSLQAGQAVRIFTGAPLPQGADYIVIQEETERNGARVTLLRGKGDQSYVRPAGADFVAGHVVSAPQLLGPQDLALLAAMNHATLPVMRKPEVAILSTGDELAMPGDTPRPDQIIASNSFGLYALMQDLGAAPRLLPIARDTAASLRTALDLAKGADLILTIGGASVGDHDLVGDVTQEMGLERSFYKVAMRPGKPLMAGRLGDAAFVGLPGNPVSAMVCGHVFVAPMVRKMLNLADLHPVVHQAPLAVPLEPNGPRAHYMRARLESGHITPDNRQDSALLSVLAQANCLMIRPPHDPAQERLAPVSYIEI